MWGICEMREKNAKVFLVEKSLLQARMKYIQDLFYLGILEKSLSFEFISESLKYSSFLQHLLSEIWHLLDSNLNSLKLKILSKMSQMQLLIKRTVEFYDRFRSKSCNASSGAGLLQRRFLFRFLVDLNEGIKMQMMEFIIFSAFFPSFNKPLIMLWV